VAGKTGTAQKPGPSGYTGEYIASFCGFFPADDPEIGILVVVDEPQTHPHTGGYVAAPSFSRIGAESARYLNMQTNERSLVLDSSGQGLVPARGTYSVLTHRR